MTDPRATPQDTIRGPAMVWRPYQIYLLGLLVLVSMSSYMDRAIMSLLQEVIKHDLSLTDWEIGLLSGPAFALLHSFAGLPVARLAERLHRPRLLSAAIVVWSSMTAFCALAGNFALLAVGRMGVGMGEGGANPISHSLVAENFTPRQRGVAMAVLSAGAPIAAILAPLIGGVVALHWGWRAAFLVVGLPGLLLAVLVWTTLREPRQEKGAKASGARPFGEDLRWLLGNRAFVFVFLAGCFNGIGIQGTAIFTSSFVMRSYGLNIAEAGGILSLRGVMGLIATFIGGYLADRFAGPRGRSYVLVPAVGALLSFLLFLGAFTAASWTLAIGLLLAANLATELKNGPNLAAVQNIVPSRMRATAAAMFFLGATVVGTTLGAALVGGASDFIAARGFPAELGDYASLCRGGHAAAGAPEALAQACKSAASAGLRAALTGLTVVFLGAATCFYMASRTIETNTD